MKTKSKNLSRKKCSLCKGDVCIHEHGEKRTDTSQAIPDMAEQTMDLLEKLLKERENNPEEILQLASRSDLRVPYGLKFQVGMDAFCLTAAVGHTEGMRRFLEAGKSPNDACAADGSTPLMLATQNRHVEAMEILLSYGADTTYLNTDGNTALILAIRTGDAKVVNTLWSYREQVDINHRNREGLTILHSAVEKRWETCVKIILSCGADVNSITDVRVPTYKPVLYSTALTVPLTCIYCI
uniref:Ankyrin repeat and KH domain-containing protein 1 n=1 Tax=Magallana gigas TaxID=29159 RepID=K1PJA6_MAGGI